MPPLQNPHPHQSPKRPPPCGTTSPTKALRPQTTWASDGLKLLVDVKEDRCGGGNNDGTSVVVYATRCTVEKIPLWIKTLKHYSGYSKEQLRDCAKIMVNLHSEAPESKLRAVYKKFSSSNHGVVAFLTPAKNLSAPPF
ncbi:hypothetical protein Fmac_018274 [Flemingia macrophylla]|uniref:Cyclin C-terminal domain-containing protein n=1 Tax=Flemingia macrophylla TaxID=520843 RepID=A0ABD1M556_9FABA